MYNVSSCFPSIPVVVVVGVVILFLVVAIAFSLYLFLMWWSGRDTFLFKGRQRKKTRVDTENMSLTKIKMTSSLPPGTNNGGGGDSPTNLAVAETSIGDSTKGMHYNITYLIWSLLLAGTNF